MWSSICSHFDVQVKSITVIIVVKRIIRQYRHRKQIIRFSWVNRISQNFVQYPDFIFSWNSTKILQSHDLVFVNPSAHYTGCWVNEFSGSKKKLPTKKKNHRRKFMKTTTYTSSPMCLHTKYYTKWTVYSSVKAKAVTNGQGVDNNRPK